jgi:hypothetical protein
MKIKLPTGIEIEGTEKEIRALLEELMKAILVSKEDLE